MHVTGLASRDSVGVHVDVSSLGTWADVDAVRSAILWPVGMHWPVRSSSRRRMPIFTLVTPKPTVVSVCGAFRHLPQLKARYVMHPPPTLMGGVCVFQNAARNLRMRRPGGRRGATSLARAALQQVFPSRVKLRARDLFPPHISPTCRTLCHFSSPASGGRTSTENLLPTFCAHAGRES